MLRVKNRRISWVSREVLGVVMATTIVGCKGPAPPSPGELAAAAASARAAAEAASGSASAAPAEPPPPVMTLHPFKAQPPSSLCTPSTTASCALDKVGDVVATDVTPVKRDGTTPLVGWAGDADTSTVPPVILVELVSATKKFYAPADRITKRPDVAEALKMPALVNAGYDLLTSFKDVDPGEYAVNVLQVNVAGTAITCSTRRKVKVE